MTQSLNALRQKRGLQSEDSGQMPIRFRPGTGVTSALLLTATRPVRSEDGIKPFVWPASCLEHIAAESEAYGGLVVAAEFVVWPVSVELLEGGHGRLGWRSRRPAVYGSARHVCACRCWRVSLL